jgi:hypothetical protein
MALNLYGIKACVFGAYGTLLDVNSAARCARDLIGEKWLPLAKGSLQDFMKRRV